MKSRMFIVFMVGYLGGIVIYESSYLWFLIFFVVGLFFKRATLFALFMILGCFFAFLRMQIVDENIEIESQEISGCVVEEVDKRKDKVIYTLEMQNGGRIFVFGPLYPLFEYGECISAVGRVTSAMEITGGYENYLKYKGIDGVLTAKNLELLTHEQVNIFYHTIFKFKSIFETKLNEVFPEPYSSFMAGLITGSRRGIPDDLMEDFQRTGLTHIIAISGYNITLIVLIANGLFSFLSRKKRVIAGIIFVTVFVILVGASAAVVRAGIMGVVGLLAVWYGREYDVMIALVLAAFVMNLWNPFILMNDIGFQLSFLATAGVVYIFPWFEKKLQFLPEFMSLRESLGMTLAAQVFVLPVLIYRFGGLSLISPLANILVLPFIPLAMVFGFFAAVVGFINQWAGLFVGYVVLKYITLIVNLLAGVPFGYFEITV